MSQDAINRAARKARHQRKLGQDAQCEGCGWSDPTALTPNGGSPSCYVCTCIKHGRPTVEEHHLLGKDNDATTTPIFGNLHRGLSDWQLDWPEEVRNNRSRDPVLFIIGLLLSTSDFCAVVGPWIRQAAMWLYAYWQNRNKHEGERWWDLPGLPTLWGTVTP